MDKHTNFDSLPDVARANLKTVCSLYAIAPATVWRRVKDGTIPRPVKDGGATRWVVGDLRKDLLAKNQQDRRAMGDLSKHGKAQP